MRDWLNKFFYMAAIVGIISRHGLIIGVHHRNQYNRSKIGMYSLLLSLYQLFSPAVNELTKSISVIKADVVYVGIHISRDIKEKHTWATNKQLWIISIIMIFKTVIPLRN